MFFKRILKSVFSEIKKIISSVFLFLPFFVCAGTVGPTLLTDIHFMNNGVVFAYTMLPRSSFPTCAHQDLNRFAVDATTAAGKAQLAGLLTAYTAGIPVEIHGLGTCTIWSDTETLNYFRVLK